MDQRKALGIENPVILLETDNPEATSQHESPRAHPVEMEEETSPRSDNVEMEEDASPRIENVMEDASPASAGHTESNLEYEFETS